MFKRLLCLSAVCVSALWAQNATISTNGHLLGPGLICRATSGSQTAYACAATSFTNSSGTAVAPGADDMLVFVADVNNTASATLAVSVSGAGTTTGTIRKQGTSANLVSGDIQGGGHYWMFFDGTYWQCPECGVNSGASTPATTNVLKGTGSLNGVAIATPGTDYVVPAGNVATASALAANGTNCGANQYAQGTDAFGNAEGCSQPSSSTLSDASSLVKNNQANAWSTGLQNFSAASFEIPTSAGFTASASSMFGYDSTAKNIHIWENGADALNIAIASTPTNNDCAKLSVSSGNVLLADAGAPCGAGSPAFSSVTAGTSTAALSVGAGGSLSPTSTGTIKATSQVDSNQNPTLLSGATASAVNQVTVTNAASGGTPSVAASGSDPNIPLNLSGKGTGPVTVNSGSGGINTAGTWAASSSLQADEIAVASMPSPASTAGNANAYAVGGTGVPAVSANGKFWYPAGSIFTRWRGIAEYNGSGTTSGVSSIGLGGATAAGTCSDIAPSGSNPDLLSCADTTTSGTNTYVGANNNIVLGSRNAWWDAWGGLETLGAGTSVTTTLWIGVTNASTLGTLGTSSNASGFSAAAFVFSTANSTSATDYVCVLNNGGSSPAMADSGIAATAGIAHIFSFREDTTASTMYFYIDGNRVCSSIGQTTNPSGAMALRLLVNNSGTTITTSAAWIFSRMETSQDY